MKLKCIHIIRIMVGLYCKIRPGLGTVYFKRRHGVLILLHIFCFPRIILFVSFCRNLPINLRNRDQFINKTIHHPGRKQVQMSAMHPAFHRPTSTLPPRDARALPIRRCSQTLGRRSGPLGSRRGRSTQERVRGQRTHHTGESPGKFGILHL